MRNFTLNSRIGKQELIIDDETCTPNSQDSLSNFAKAQHNDTHLTTKLKIAKRYARTRNGGARAAIVYFNINVAIAESIVRTTTAMSWAVTIGRCKEITVGAVRTNGCAMTVIASRCISGATKGSTVLETCPMRWIAVMIIVSLPCS